MNAPLRPFYVDLDRSLVRADVGLESFLRFARRGPRAVLLLCLWLLRGRGFAKMMVARRTRLDPAFLPYRPEVLAMIEKARAEGRPVILASASHRRYVAQIARHLDLFDGVLASTAGHNLKGRAKLGRISAHCGAAAFDYLGDSRADRPIWAAAGRGFTVGATGPGAERVGEPQGRRATGSALLRAMRPHQWSKNVLVLVPLLTSGLVGQPIACLRALAAAALFSLVASGAYLLNDCLDLDADRAHAEKRSRPLASGRLGIPLAISVACGLLVLGIAGAFALDAGLGGVLAGYGVATLSYSLVLKRVATLDVIALSALYSVRIWAGAVAIGVAPSFWLLLFSTFFFLSCAYLKRYIELRDRAGQADVPGRGYWPGEAELVASCGVGAGQVSVLVLALFVNAGPASTAAGTPALLWALCPAMLWWINRLWLLARRGQVQADPIAFALRDPASLIAAAMMAVLYLAAQRLALG
jgi:4-hydroxybenzoate polyprenyltransferase